MNRIKKMKQQRKFSRSLSLTLEYLEVHKRAENERKEYKKFRKKFQN